MPQQVQKKQNQEQQKGFLEKVIDRSELQTENEAQVATKVVFRIMRDLMPRDEVSKISDELQKKLHKEAHKGNMEIADLWNDPNVMVAFFSRISLLQQLSIDSDTFLLRLAQEGQLPENVNSEDVTKAVFSALKEELPEQKSNQIAQFLPEGIRQLW